LTEAAGGRVRVSHVLPERRLQISGPTVLGEKVSEGLIGRRDRVGALEPWSPGNLGAPEKSDANHLYCPRGDCTLKVGNNLHTTRNTLPHLITNG
jgi:hypothetical protein